MTTTIALIITAALAVVIFILWNLTQKISDLKDSQTNDKSLLLLNQNIQGMSERLDKTSESLNSRLDKAAHVIGAVAKELGTVQERFKGFEEFNELLHPKMRGNIGEQILADMLAQVFPAEQYLLQYKFKDGHTVDAAIKTQSGLIPVDSKFPLENFRQMTRATNDDEKGVAAKEFSKAVKKHIDDISKKYIVPEEGTVNFAVMYVPSENVYYQIMTDEESGLMDHARDKCVLITSPHGFFNFLRVILMGMERNKLHEQAQKIWDILKGVQQESIKFNDTLGVLGRHITNAKGAMDATSAGFAKLTGKLDSIKLLDDHPKALDSEKS